MKPLTKQQHEVLLQYEKTSEVLYLQDVPGASSLPVGLLEWMGTSYGTSFYRITDEGRAALKEPPRYDS